MLGCSKLLTLNTCRDGAFTTSLGNLFQCLITLIVKNFFHVSNLNLPSLDSTWGISIFNTVFWFAICFKLEEMDSISNRCQYIIALEEWGDTGMLSSISNFPGNHAVVHLSGVDFSVIFSYACSTSPVSFPIAFLI